MSRVRVLRPRERQLNAMPRSPAERTRTDQRVDGLFQSASAMTIRCACRRRNSARFFRAAAAPNRHNAQSASEPTKPRPESGSSSIHRRSLSPSPHDERQEGLLRETARQASWAGGIALGGFKIKALPQAWQARIPQGIIAGKLNFVMPATTQAAGALIKCRCQSPRHGVFPLDR